MKWKKTYDLLFSDRNGGFCPYNASLSANQCWLVSEECTTEDDRMSSVEPGAEYE